MEPERSTEKRSLEIGKWANLIMACAGIIASFLSRSDALLVDGLYSGVNFFSAIIAAKISVAVTRPADSRYPFGYDAQEPLYVTFRSLVLLGIIVFALFGAVSKILTYLTGGEVPELVFGPILVYAISMVLICFSLAGWHYINWRKSGKQSEILMTEAKAAVIDAILSAGAGCGLMAVGLLRGTAFEPIVPISDALVVLVLCALMTAQPVKMLLAALGEVAGKAAESKSAEQIRESLRAFFSDKSCTLLEVVVTKLGRGYFVVSYLRPDSPISGQMADALYHEQERHLRSVISQVKSELVVAQEPRSRGGQREGMFKGSS